MSERFTSLLHSVTDDAVNDYENKLFLIIDYVNKRLGRRKDLPVMIGKNPFSVMEDNNRNHANFMVSMFRLKDGSTFVDTVAWVYKSYMDRGFSSSHFPVVLELWKEAVENNLEKNNISLVSSVYDEMLERHNDFSKFSDITCKFEVKDEVKPQFESYLSAILEPDMERALKIAEEYVKNISLISIFMEDILRPAMYEVGRLWSEGVITVGQEHLASSISQRVMALFYPYILKEPRNKEKILITASPGELHEIGSRMIADLLELRGWNVYYMGANTPKESIVSFLKVNKVPFLGISTTMIYNISSVREIINEIRKEEKPDFYVKIIVGGQAYIYNPKLWKDIGADGYASGADEAVKYFQEMNC